MSPFFSVVIPVWNRADSLKKCVESVLAQDFSDFELIAVDDASTDESISILESFHDPRMRILRHKENRGVCATRYTGTTETRGQWIVPLDSDWALLPGALTKFHKMALEAPADVGLIGGLARTDTGEVWPVKRAPEGPFGFPEFLVWKDSDGATDFMSCRRREVFETVQWPQDRRLETQFHLKVARRWKSWICNEELGFVGTISPNRFTTDRSQKADDRKLAMAPYLAADYREIIRDFGSERRRYVPRLYNSDLELAAGFSFLAGQRRSGAYYAVRALLRRPWRLQLMGLVLAGMISPRTVLRLRRLARRAGLA